MGLYSSSPTINPAKPIHSLSVCEYLVLSSLILECVCIRLCGLAQGDHVDSGFVVFVDVLQPPVSTGIF